MRERFTLGVEEEYQLVEPESGELRSGSHLALAEDRSGEVEGELQQTMLEIGTPVCRDSRELQVRLRERRFQAGTAAAAVGLEMLAVGMHPFSGWKAQQLTRTDRSRMLKERFRHIVRMEHICGMHVHVAVPDHFDRIVVMNTVRAYMPHLLSLSCSSPFHAGEDTGFSSFRTVDWRRFPLSGTPPHFESQEEHRRFMAELLRSGMIADERTVYWSVRPSPRYPTLEVRICDVCPRIEDAVCIAALARAVVIAAAEKLLPSIGSTLSAPLQDAMLRENEWYAAREGLDGVLTVPEHPEGQVPIRDAVSELVERVRPIAEELGDGEALNRVAVILEHGTAADQMRVQYAETGDLRAVVDWGIRQTRAGTGMDRRRPDVQAGSS
jgi:glutamate---cysteine ligase / carboxylate-amine ligase